jgi:hypothetical protein
MRDRMQQSRFELKYLISENTAQRLRDFVRCYLSMDEFSVGRPNYSYPVHSLYLDSDSLEIYWRTVNGDKNRFKLRLRYYSDNADTPVFFEIKRRMKDVILKQRGGVRQSAVPLLLNGQLPEEKHMITKDPGSLVAVQRFQSLMMQLNAKPKSHIFYQREAYVADNDEVRVTMDRDVRFEPDETGCREFELDDDSRANKTVQSLLRPIRFVLDEGRLTDATVYTQLLQFVGTPARPRNPRQPEEGSPSQPVPAAARRAPGARPEAAWGRSWWFMPPWSQQRNQFGSASFHE